AVRCRRRTGFHGFAGQIALDVAGQAVGGLIAPVAILVQRLHRNPVQFTADEPWQLGRLNSAFGGDRGQLLSRTQAITQGRHVLFADDSQDFQDAFFPDALLTQGSRSGDQFVEQHAKRVDVASGVHVLRSKACLLRAHVFERADDLSELGRQLPFGQLRPDRLGHTEVDDLWHGRAVVRGYEYVRWLQVAMDDPFLVGVLYRMADRDNQLQSIGQGQLFFITIGRDRLPVDQFHDKVVRGDEAGVFDDARIQDPGDIGVVHQCEGLPFLLEPGEQVFRRAARPHDFERHAALDWLGLVGNPNFAHAAFAQLLTQHEATVEDAIRSQYRLRSCEDGCVSAAFEDARFPSVSGEQNVNSPP